MGSKLSEQQLLNLVGLLSTTLEENSVLSNGRPSSDAPTGSDDMEESGDAPKRQRVADDKLCGFVADCTSVLLSQCRVDLPTDLVVKLHNVSYFLDINYVTKSV